MVCRGSQATATDRATHLPAVTGATVALRLLEVVDAVLLAVLALVVDAVDARLAVALVASTLPAAVGALRGASVFMAAASEFE